MGGYLSRKILGAKSTVQGLLHLFSSELLGPSSKRIAKKEFLKLKQSHENDQRTRKHYKLQEPNPFFRASLGITVNYLKFKVLITSLELIREIKIRSSGWVLKLDKFKT